MKKMIMAAMMAAAPAAWGQAEPVRAIDLNAPLADARLGLAWNTDGEQLGIMYVPLIYWVGAEQQEYATLNLGASDKLRIGRVKYLISAGPRIDTLFSKAAGMKFSQKHFRFAILPPLQVNFNLITQNFRKFEPWLSVCTRFGGK